jgi:hypothetical protein
MWATILTVIGSHGIAQSGAQTARLRGVQRFALEGSGLSMRGPVRPWAYLGDQGRRAALFGDETGSFEAWIWPLKLVRDVRLAFKVPEYDEPIAGAAVARDVIIRPEGATIVYTHPSFTVRQHLYVPLNDPGVIMLLDVDAVRPLEILVRMHAEFNLAWPGSFGGGDITWQPDQRRFLLLQGGVRWYNAFIGSPFASNGTSHAAHDGPTVPAQFVIRYDSRSSSDYIPIVIAGGATARDSVELVYRRLLERAPTLWREKVAHYRSVSSQQLGITSPDAQINQALEWSKVNLDQQLVCSPDLGCSLGYGRASGDAAITSLAMNAVGHFERVRDELRFRALRGDASPFWILACSAYWKASGDDAFVKQQWPSLVKAFRSSASTDTDGDGLLENPKADAGAIEISGLGVDIRTDIYLAGVWVAALEGMQELARAAGDLGIAAEASALYERAQNSLESKFWLGGAGIYVFAILQPAENSAAPRMNDALTVWPSAAMSFGLLDDARSDRMLREVGSSAITADWGARMLSREHHLYDPLNYNNGTVSPLVTGFVAVAHYRYHRSWAGHDLVRDVARATFDFARGRTPKVLSGALYDVLETAGPQQFFATSMLVTPLVRGMIGIEPDAPNRALSIEPHLPAEWNSLDVTNIAVGGHRVSMSIRRGHGKYEISLRRTGPAAPLFVRLAPALPLGARIEGARINDRDVPTHAEETAHDVHAMIELTLSAAAEIEIEYDGGIEVSAPEETLRLGDPSTALRVLDFRRDGRDYVLLVEGTGTNTYSLELRAETRVRSVTGADLVSQANQRVQLRLQTAAATAQVVRREIRIRT